MLFEFLDIHFLILTNFLCVIVDVYDFDLFQRFAKGSLLRFHTSCFKKQNGFNLKYDFKKSNMKKIICFEISFLSPPPPPPQNIILKLYLFIYLFQRLMQPGFQCVKIMLTSWNPMVNITRQPLTSWPVIETMMPSIYLNDIVCTSESYFHKIVIP